MKTKATLRPPLIFRARAGAEGADSVTRNLPYAAAGRDETGSFSLGSEDGADAVKPRPASSSPDAERPPRDATISDYTLRTNYS